MKMFHKSAILTQLLLIAILAAVTTVSCGESNNQSNQAANAESPADSLEISTAAFDKKYKANPNIQILDVRTPGEYGNFHIHGGVLLPVQEIMAEGEAIQSKIPFAKDSEIYVICRSGSRSFTATRILRSMGYTKVYSVNGGHSAWMNMGYSCESKELDC
jgi:rhodanese-related sulfurtransferase